MKKILGAIIILVVVSIFVYQNLDDEAFAVSFRSSLSVGIILTVITGFLVIQFTELTQKPSLEMKVKQGRIYDDKIKVTQVEDGGFYDISFHIAIKNQGNKVLKPHEGYWHLYLPDASAVFQDNKGSKFASTDKKHLRNPIELPIFPKSFLDVGPEFKLYIKKEKFENFRVYYFFETSYGYFPKSVKIDQKTGLVQFNDMAEIPLEIQT